MKAYKLVILIGFAAAACSQEPTEQVHEDEVVVATGSMESESTKQDSILQCSGQIAIPPNAEISLHSPIGALIKSIEVMEGEKVKKGETIVTLEHLNIIKMQEEYLTAKATYELAKSELDRKTILHDKNVLSDRDFDQAKQQYESAFAHFESMKSQLKFLGLSMNQLNEGKIQQSLAIRAPMNGVVTHIASKTGQFAAQDMELINLIDDSHKHVHLQVFAEDAMKLKEGQKITVTTTDSNKEYEAEVYLIGKSLDPTTNTVSVHCHLVNEENDLVVGRFVFAKIKVK